MKKILTIALCAMMFAACDDKDPGKNPGGEKPKPGTISFAATIAPGDYTLSNVGFALTANDAVSVIFDESSAASQYKVASIADGTATLTGGLKWPGFGSSHKFYSYINGKDYSEGNVSISGPVFSGDGDNSHIKSSMFLVAESVNATAPAEGADNNPVSIKFNNLMSVIEVKLAALYADDFTISKIEIEAANDIFPTDGKVNVKATGSDFGKIVSTTKTKTTSLSLTGSPKLPEADDATAPTNTKSFFIPIAATGDSGELKVTITTAEGPQNFTVDAKTFELGKLYPITLVVVGGEEQLTAWDGSSRVKPELDTDGKTFLITKGAELAWISEAYRISHITNTEDKDYDKDLTKCPNLQGLTFKLAANIDLNNHDWMKGADSLKSPKNFQIGGINDKGFRGIIDGAGYYIRNFYIKISDNSIIGLVRANQGTIKDLTIRGKIEGTGTQTTQTTPAAITNIGAFAGRNEDGSTAVNGNKDAWRGKIENCHSYVDIDVKNVKLVGGITGENGRKSIKGIIIGCTNHGNINVKKGVAAEITGPHIISNGSEVGGIVGRSQGDFVPAVDDKGNVVPIGIFNCRNYGSVTSDMVWSNAEGVGGIVGSLYAGPVQQCANEGNVTSVAIAGGIVGRSGAAERALVTACYNTGDITATDTDAGGVIAYVHSHNTSLSGTVTACYNIGKVTAKNNAGGLAGWNLGTVKTSYWGGKCTLTVAAGKEDPATEGERPSGTSTTCAQFSESSWPNDRQEGWGADPGYWTLGTAPNNWPTLK